jgi:hypothetical protein
VVLHNNLAGGESLRRPLCFSFSPQASAQGSVVPETNTLMLSGAGWFPPVDIIPPGYFRLFPK